MVIFLIGIIALTIIPPSLFHAHEEHGHLVSKIKNDPNHHCKLDEQFCENLPQKNCENHQHLSTPNEKCFTCDYHFLNHYYAEKVPSNSLINFSFINYSIGYVTYLSQLSLTFGNKGPPAVA